MSLIRSALEFGGCVVAAMFVYATVFVLGFGLIPETVRQRIGGIAATWARVSRLYFMALQLAVLCYVIWASLEMWISQWGSCKGVCYARA